MTCPHEKQQETVVRTLHMLNDEKIPLHDYFHFPFWPELWQRFTNISANTYLDKSLGWLYVPYQPKTFLVDNKSKADSSHFPYLEFLYHQTKLLKVQKRLNTVDKECWYMKNSTAVL